MSRRCGSAASEARSAVAQQHRRLECGVTGYLECVRVDGVAEAFDLDQEVGRFVAAEHGIVDADVDPLGRSGSGGTGRYGGRGQLYAEVEVTRVRRIVRRALQRDCGVQVVRVV